MLVRLALESVRHYKTVMIGEDTDLLVLLCYHCEQTSKPLILLFEPKQGNSKSTRVWDIHETMLVLGEKVKRYAVLCHYFMQQQEVILLPERLELVNHKP